jgi:hypothetical protein
VMSKLFRVERLTQPRGKRLLTVDVFAVLAATPEAARTKAAERMPQDELDGPVVRYAVEEDIDGIIKTSSRQRRGAMPEADTFEVMPATLHTEDM